MWKNTERNNKKQLKFIFGTGKCFVYKGNYVNSSLLFLTAKLTSTKETCTGIFSFQRKITRVDEINLKNMIFTAR